MENFCNGPRVSEVKLALLTILREHRKRYPETYVGVPKRILWEELREKFNIDRERFERIVAELMCQGLVYESRQDFLKEA